MLWGKQIVSREEAVLDIPDVVVAEVVSVEVPLTVIPIDIDDRDALYTPPSIVTTH